MTQHELVLEYIKQHGSILPAKMAGVVYMGHMFGSETSKRCRELRKKGVLVSEGDGKFVVFKMKEVGQTSLYKITEPVWREP